MHRGILFIAAVLFAASALWQPGARGGPQCTPRPAPTGPSDFDVAGVRSGASGDGRYVMAQGKSGSYVYVEVGGSYVGAGHDVQAGDVRAAGSHYLYPDGSVDSCLQLTP